MTLPGNIISGKNGGLDSIVGPEGNLIKLGLLAPDDSSPRVFASIESSPLMLTKEQIMAAVTLFKNRKTAREIFTPDWIKDQDGLGACQGYASAGATERAIVLRGGKHVKLSGDFAYSLVNGGRDNGSQLASGLIACQETGYAPEDTPGLTRWEYRKNRMPAAAFEAAKRFRGFEGYEATTELGLYSGLARGFVGVIAVHVAGNYSRLDKYGISQGGNGPGNHAVCVDDLIWDASYGQFKIDSPGSWKTSWGDNGRCYFTFERHLKQTRNNHKFYLLRSASDDPLSDNPKPIKD